MGSTRFVLFLLCALHLSNYASAYDMIEKVVCENGEAYLECPAGEIISISTGTYGRKDKTTCSHAQTDDTDCRADHTRFILQEQCQGKRTCYASAFNSVFGDPCPGTYKYLKFDYRCIPEQFGLFEFCAIPCQGETLHLDCGAGKAIDLTQGGTFGRTDIVTCVSSGTSVADTDCSFYASDHLRDKCEGKQTCDILIDAAEFGTDPCPGTDKYLDLWYMCK
ncbi:L-rhamnose-binding lectin CSL3-like [Ptychodera flava]|uniref:L-rhamnose-binding lectin CSL3-like n=1 Tax=Ptychodera flava TaxID=63121 RepID=UPI00396A4408